MSLTVLLCLSVFTCLIWAVVYIRIRMENRGKTVIRHDWRFYYHDGFFRCVRRDGGREVFEKTLADLRDLTVVTSNRGPFLCDAALLFRFSDTVAEVSLDHPDWPDMYEVLVTLLPLDLQAFINAMACFDNAVFPIWSRARHDG